MKKILSLTLLLISLNLWSNDINFSPIPSWVKPVEIPQSSNFSKYDIESGYYIKLYDYQTNLDDYSMFNHYVIKVASYSGITNASQITVSYDSTYQKLSIHHLYIWRDGKKIDRTKDLSFENIKNETNLNRGIYIGYVTAYDNLEDIRKDDMIDFAYSLDGYNPIFGEYRYLFSSLEFQSYIDLFSLIINHQSYKNYSYRKDNSPEINFTDTVIGKTRTIDIKVKDLKPYKTEPNTPSWVIPYKYFSLTNMRSWKEVNYWAQEVFALKEQPDLQNVYKELLSGNETQDEKINKLINYVQDDIRYMGIETGIWGIKPTNPEEVVSQRFGDCKDKSLLLVYLLKGIGIDKAYPVLVNTSMQNELNSLLPSNELFNHCIVKFEYNDSTYWVDPTYTLQGGDFKNIYNYDYGKVLVVGEPSNQLSQMNPKQVKNGVEGYDELTINSFNTPATLVMTSKRYGYDADSRRSMLEYYSMKDFSDMIEKELKHLFPKVEKKEEIKIDDNEDENILTAQYKYEVDNLWQEDVTTKNVKYMYLKLFSTTITDFLNESECEKRDFDYYQPYPFNYNYTFIVHLPKELIFNDQYEEYENEAFKITEAVEQLDGNSIKFNYTLDTKANYIKADRFKEICEFKQKIAKQLQTIIYFYQ